MHDNVREVPLCETCRSIGFEQLLSGNGAGFVKLGELVKIRHRSWDCRFCGYLINWFDSPEVVASLDDYGRSNPVDDRTVDIQADCRGYISNTQQQIFYLDISVTPHGARTTLAPCLFPVPSVRSYWESRDAALDRGGRSYSNRFIESTADIRLPKKWLRLCEELHTHRCEYPSWLGQNEYPHSLRLVDVDAMCLVENVACCRYICLSYVWGPDHLNFQATKATIRSLRQKRSLSGCNLPKTIVDAICFVRDMGESYLWVDSLCILQDDEYDKSVHIVQMDLIFSRALLTVAVGTGNDCNAGIPHLYRNIRTPVQRCVQVSSRLALMQDETVWMTNTTRSKWSSRGWTYQELHLSRRALIIHEDMLHWKCECEYWNEVSCLEPGPFEESELSPIRHFGSTSLGVTLPEPKFDLTSLGMHIFHYNFSRRFKNESDALVAFRGILKRIERVSGTKFHWGMPRDSFHLWLLWGDHYLSGWRKSASRRRSKCLLPTRNEPPRSVPFPSWSWIGWYTHLHTPVYEGSGYKSDNDWFRSKDIIWAAQWLSIDSSGATSGIEVHRGNYKVPITWLDRPPWAGEPLTPDCRPFGEDWEDSGRIIARTSYARLRIRTSIFEMLTRRKGICPTDSHNYDLLDQEMKVLGVRALKATDFAASVAEGSEEDWLEEKKNGRLRDFIVLSRERFLDMSGSSDEDSSDVQGCQAKLNLMMVEWNPAEPGVASRLGIFHMEERYWMLHNPEWKCVTLA